LADGGTVTMPFAETFWAARFGMLVDKFGTPWMVTATGPPDGRNQRGRVRSPPDTGSWVG